MNSEIIKKFCDLLGEERVFTGEAMSRHTTFKIGGPADYFLMPDKDTDVGRIVKICKESAIPYFILGNGSNLLVGDGGYRGAVIQIYKNMSAVTVEGTEITVQAGARFHRWQQQQKMQLLQALSLQAGSRELWAVRL